MQETGKLNVFHVIKEDQFYICLSVCEQHLHMPRVLGAFPRLYLLNASFLVPFLLPKVDVWADVIYLRPFWTCVGVS